MRWLARMKRLLTRRPRSSAGPPPTLSIELPARSSAWPCEYWSWSPKGRFISRSGQRMCQRLASAQGLVVTTAGGLGGGAGCCWAPAVATGTAAIATRRAVRASRGIVRSSGAGTGVHGPPNTRQRISYHRVRHAETGPAAIRDARRKDSGHHVAAPVDHRTAGVARPDQAAQRRDQAPDGALSVGVLGERRAGVAEPARLDVIGPVLREAEDGRGGARLGRDVQAQRRDVGQGAGAKDRYGVLRVEPHRIRVVVGPLAARLDRCVVLTGNHVSVRHDQAVAGRPAAALHAQAAGGPEHLDHAAPGGLDLWVAGDRRVWRRDPGLGPRDRGEGIEAGEGLKDRAGRGQDVVELLQDRRPLDRLAQLPGPRRLQRHGADHPCEPEPETGEQCRAAQAVEHPELVPEPVTEVEAQDLEPRGEEAAEEERADEGEHRRILGM